jgi:hypothetical protein
MFGKGGGSGADRAAGAFREVANADLHLRPGGRRRRHRRVDMLLSVLAFQFGPKQAVPIMAAVGGDGVVTAAAPSRS